MKKAIESEFSLPLGKFYMFCVHVMYTPCSKLPFSMEHAKWQLRLSDNDKHCGSYMALWQH